MLIFMPYSLKEGYEELESFFSRCDKIDTAIFDVDNTAVKGRMSNCARYLLDEEKNSGRLDNVVRGLYAGSRIMVGTKIRGDTVSSDNWGLGKFIRTLEKSGIEKERVQNSAGYYFEKNKLPGFTDLVDTLKEDYEMSIHLVTGSPDIVIEPLAKRLGATYTAQKVVYRDEIPVDVEFLFNSPYEKMLKARKDLDKQNKNITDTVCFGNDGRDVFLKYCSSVFVSSPLADKETRELADIKLGGERGYPWLNDKLKTFSVLTGKARI